jgi:hypothetical protein
LLLLNVASIILIVAGGANGVYIADGPGSTGTTNASGSRRAYTVGDMTSPDHPCVDDCGHSKSLRPLIMCCRRAQRDVNDGRGSTVGGLWRHATTSSKVMIVSILKRTLAHGGGERLTNQ